MFQAIVLFGKGTLLVDCGTIHEYRFVHSAYELVHHRLLVHCSLTYLIQNSAIVGWIGCLLSCDVKLRYMS